VSPSQCPTVYPVYVVQIANVDVARILRDNVDLVCHIYVAGAPSSGEIGDTSEMNYRYIAQQIAELNHDGIVCHEYRPSAGRNRLIRLAIGRNCQLNQLTMMFRPVARHEQ